MKTKKILITLILIVFIVLLSGGNVKAVLQANPSTHTRKTANLGSWMSGIRQMEMAGGAMGLSETFNNNYTSKSESNGIDVHCIRTTEYGAMAILSTSGYGNPSNDAVITTTTGNNTGIMINTGSWEWTAGVSNASTLSGIDTRYYDLYIFDNASSAKTGDALGSSSITNPGCVGWHGSTSSRWLTYKDSNCGFVRGKSSIFAFDGGGSGWSNGERLGKQQLVWSCDSSMR